MDLQGRHGAFDRPLAWGTLVIAAAAAVTIGAVFGTVSGRADYHGAFLSLVTLTSAVVGGATVVVLVLARLVHEAQGPADGMLGWARIWMLVPFLAAAVYLDRAPRRAGPARHADRSLRLHHHRPIGFARPRRQLTRRGAGLSSERARPLDPGARQRRRGGADQARPPVPDERTRSRRIGLTEGGATRPRLSWRGPRAGGWAIRRSLPRSRSRCRTGSRH